ncbi:MAG: hypothetical protein COA58_00775 [Bacteroidetes bacterium]|nr:MAG: hypothetical protein COA58_00775 [Bacteroidota bacterium]
MNKLNLTFSHLRNQCIPLVKGLACFFLIVTASAFQAKEVIKNTPIANNNTADGERLVTLHSDEFKAFTNRIHRQLEYPTGYDSLREDVLENALRGYMYLKHTQALSNTKYLTVIDFSKYCNNRRLWVIDMETKEVVFNEWVAHGAKTGDQYAKYFSNRHSSNKSSLGFYTTGGLYNGSNKLSLKLNGLEKNFNSNAFARGIVIHGANYVDETIVNRKERIGRSFGCPAVSEDINKILVNTIKGGNCLFIWHPTTYYLKNSKILNANLYITVDDLSI